SPTAGTANGNGTSDGRRRRASSNPAVSRASAAWSCISTSCTARSAASASLATSSEKGTWRNWNGRSRAFRCAVTRWKRRRGRSGSPTISAIWTLVILSICSSPDPPSPGNRAEKNRRGVQQAAGQYEQVPHHVVERKSAPDEEHGAGGVGDAARDEKPETGGRQRGGKGLPGEEGDPAQGDVEQRRQEQKLFHEKGFEHRPRQRQAPDGAEQGPAGGAPENEQRKRRVRAGDEQKDGRMVQRFEHVFGTAGRKAVDEGRGDVEHEHRGAVDGKRRDVP